MDWLFQDWEHEFAKDEIYAIEKQRQVELEWQQWEEEYKDKNRKPAIIKVDKYENKHLASAMGRINKKRI